MAATRFRRLSLRVAVAAFAAAALVVLYRAPALFVVNTWRADPYYTHGALVMALALGLGAWRLLRADRARAAVPGWAPVAIASAAGAYAVGFLLHSAHMIAWSAPALAAAVALATGGFQRLRLLAAPLLLAALTLPTPWTLELGIVLQDAATAASAALLRLAGLPLVVDLYTLHVGDLAFEVTAACSGFQSAVSLLAVAAVVATVFPMPPTRRRLVLLCAVPVALLLNVARILAVVCVGLLWGAEAAEGFFHGASSALLFAGETLAVLAIGGLLRAPGVRPRGPA